MGGAFAAAPCTTLPGTSDAGAARHGKADATKAPVQTVFAKTTAVNRNFLLFFRSIARSYRDP